jgi:hypothetical protein
MKKMKKLTRSELKNTKGGGDLGRSPCSTGSCGPEGRYNCSAEYEEEAEPTSEPVCCCGHSDYNHECGGA